MSTNLFDLSQEYDAMLQQGIRFSGEDKRFFIVGRVRGLRRELPAGFQPRRVLDFGCGIGDSTHLLAHFFPEAEVTGIDTAEQALAYAREVYGTDRVRFASVAGFEERGVYDLCYVNGVFHHIVPAERIPALRMIHRALAAGGYLGLFENNPWNPGTRIVMSHIPFDHDAQTFAPPAARRLLRRAGFAPPIISRSFFYFPRPLAALRPAERVLRFLPLGAQYLVLGRK